MTFVSTISEVIASIPLWAVVTVGIITLIYQYLTWTFDYWEKQGVKFVKPYPFLGSFYSPHRNMSLEEQDLEAYVKYGRVVGLYEGRNPALLVGDPELLRTILVKDFHAFTNRRRFEFPKKSFFSKMVSTMEGEEWKALRNVITPTFTTGKMKQMFKLIDECAEQMVKHLKNFADEDKAFEAKERFSSFTIDVIATCAFGTKIDSVQDRDSKFVKMVTNQIGKVPKWIIVMFFLPKKVAMLFTRFMPTTVFDYLAGVINEVMEKRKSETNPRRDFLQLLLEAKKEYEKELEENADQEKIDKAAIKQSVLTYDHITAQVMLFLLAGFETSSITSSFVLYYLATNEEVQEKLHQEIDDILEQNNNVVTYEVVAQMQYLEMVISETLRIAPPATRMDRSCSIDGYKLGDITLKNNMLILIPVYSMHHDPEFYPNPEIFDPERFSPENRNNRNPYTYLPFGYGPRNCIGLRFALMAIKIGLVHLLRDFKIKRCAETEVPFKRKLNNMFFQPEANMIKVEYRRSN